MAFPKTQSGADLMMGAPSKVPDDLLEELHLGVVDEEG
jgi:aspartyl-tRNA synthetase